MATRRRLADLRPPDGEPTSERKGDVESGVREEEEEDEEGGAPRRRFMRTFTFPRPAGWLADAESERGKSKREAQQPGKENDGMKLSNGTKGREREKGILRVKRSRRLQLRVAKGEARGEAKWSRSRFFQQHFSTKEVQ